MNCGFLPQSFSGQPSVQPDAPVGPLDSVPQTEPTQSMNTTTTALSSTTPLVAQPSHSAQGLSVTLTSICGAQRVRVTPHLLQLLGLLQHQFRLLETLQLHLLPIAQLPHPQEHLARFLQDLQLLHLVVLQQSQGLPLQDQVRLSELNHQPLSLLMLHLRDLPYHQRHQLRFLDGLQLLERLVLRGHLHLIHRPHLIRQANQHQDQLQQATLPLDLLGMGPLLQILPPLRLSNRLQGGLLGDLRSGGMFQMEVD